jgi:hypothetical protein
MADNVDAIAEHPRPSVEGSSVDSGSDSIDAKLGSVHIGGGTAAGAVASGDAASNLYRYNMDHRERGKFIIINNKKFHPVTRMNERSGTDEDASNLYCDFKRLGFTVELHHNKTKDEMLQLMIKVSLEDHTNRDCLGVAVLTHGDDGVLYGVDNIITVDNFVKPIKGCRTLAGKPKIFLFQACRGNELDDGMEVSDAHGESPAPAQRIPLEADFVYAYSTTPGYFSWRNSAKGSWFVQALHKVLERHGTELDFLKILTRVNYEVAYGFESNASQAHMTRKKQVPSIVSMLTKELYFTRK